MQDIQKYPTVTSLQIQLADPSLEKEKKSIYSHPLYPLLALLLEQCEQATSSPDSQTPDTFDADLQSYIQRHEGNDKMFLTENKELDTLIIKAIQVLRIHLNELRKVNELCRDFCSRYINCLKTKIHQDSMFDDSEESSPNGSERLSPNIMSGSAYNSPYNLQAGSVARNYLEMGSNHRHQHMLDHLHNMGHNCSANMNGISVDCVDYMNGNSSSPPLSGISLQDEINNNNYMTSSTNPGVYNNLLDPSKQKRGVLPKKATQIMKQWLFQHLVHPYPTEDEKRQIANQTNLTLLQVNNWFINARRRILQPMLDNGGSPSKDKTSSGNSKLDKSDSVSESEDTGSGLMYNSSCGNRKKKAATNRPSNNRFWPASLAAAVNILSPHPAMTTCIAPSPVAPTAPDRSTPKILSQIETLDPSRSRKRTKTVSSDIDVYQPPKVFSSVKESYDSYMTELDYNKSHHRKDTKSQSDRSTPQYTELSSPNNSKSNSLDDSDRTRSESFCPPLTNLPTIRHTSPKPSQDNQKLLKPDIISSYLSTTNNFNTTSHDLSAVSLFPPNPCPYVPTNPYANIIMPQTNAYLTHPAMLYNVSLQRAVQHNEANSMSSALFGMRHPSPHPFPMYDSIYPNYEHLMDKRSNMASHINDLFATPHGFSKSFSQYASMDNSSSVCVKNEFMDSIPESGSLNNNTNTNNNHSHSHFDTFPNFKAFHSKTNTN